MAWAAAKPWEVGVHWRAVASYATPRLQATFEFAPSVGLVGSKRRPEGAQLTELPVRKQGDGTVAPVDTDPATVYDEMVQLFSAMELP